MQSVHHFDHYLYPFTQTFLSQISLDVLHALIKDLTYLIQQLNTYLRFINAKLAPTSLLKQQVHLTTQTYCSVHFQQLVLCDF